jgi:hypothetical protein
MSRPHGSKNKVSSVARLKLAKLKCDPIERAVKCANELYEEGHIRDAGNMYLDLIGYIVPKLKAMEISSDQESPVSFQIVLSK